MSLPGATQYLNFDSEADRKILKEKSWIRQEGLLVMDELHKMKGWKRWLKGIYDTEGLRPNLLVTGSARLDVFRKGGESLAGRHFHLRLHPFSVREAGGDSGKALETLLKFGGFRPLPRERSWRTWLPATCSSGRITWRTFSGKAPSFFM